jgi:hypothetical protein
MLLFPTGGVQKTMDGLPKVCFEGLGLTEYLGYLLGWSSMQVSGTIPPFVQLKDASTIYLAIYALSFS